MGFLEDMGLFVQVVEKGSFSAAGRHVRMSAALVSHRINALENKLGARLFSRTTRRMQLTSSGRAFHEHAVTVIEAAQRAEASVAEMGGTPRGSLKVTAPLGLGRRVLGDTAARFRQEHPEIDIRVRLSEHLLDLVDEGVDVALRMASFSDSSMILKRVAEVDRILCASPAYIERAGEPPTPQDLTKHSCLLLRFPGSQQFRWSLGRKGEEPAPFAVAGHMDADDGDLITHWALAGHGIALKPIFEVAEHLANGRLVPVLPAWRPTSVTLGVVYLSRQLVPPKVRLFAEALHEDALAHVRAALARIGRV